MSKAVFIEALERGVTAHQEGRLSDAVKSYQAALEIRPNDAEASSLYGLALLHSGKGEEALPLLQQAVDREPKQTAYRLNLAEGLAQTGQPDRAMVQLGLIIASEPTNATALSRFYALEADALIARREWSQLYASATSWTKADPKAPGAWRALARAAFEDGRMMESSAAFDRYLTLTRPTVADLTAYAGLCLQTLQIDSASRALDQAEALDPNFAQMLASRGLVMMYLGRFEEAEQYCRRALQQNPHFVPAYTTLSRVRRGALENADLRQLAELGRRTDVYLDYRVPAIYAVAHAHDARGDYDSAFATYTAAHKLALERDAIEKRSYDATQEAARVQKIVELSAALPEVAAPANAPRPIFIVGMPRSGTTLIESVLGAHSRVYACGERGAMRGILRLLLGLELTQEVANERALQDWGRLYFRELPDIGSADHITDKHPRNLEAAGLIARMLPNAVIVNLRRNPVETCLSVYRQEFNKHWTFTHRFEDIADYYGRYAQLAAHWEQTLPGRFMTIQYEDFVTDFANAAPRLVQACGLTWEPQCFEFQKSPRAITTFSTVQARSEVVLSSRAHKYAKHLGPLIAKLEAAGVDLETGALKGN